MKTSRLFWTVTGIALLFRAILLLWTGPGARYALPSDSHSYLAPANALKETGQFRSFNAAGDSVPETYRTPGYPLFLIPFLTGDHQIRHRAVQWVQALASALSAGVLALCAFLYWKSMKAAWVAGMALALDFVYAVHTLFVLTDVLFVVLLTLALYACSREKFGWGGLLIAISAFVRPVSVYLPIVLGAALLASLSQSRSKAYLRSVVLFFILSFVPILGWMARNHAYTNTWTFTSLQAANLYLVRVALVEAHSRQIPYDQAVSELEAAAQAGSGNAIQYLLNHKWAYVRFMMKDAVKLFAGNSMKIAAWALLKDENFAHGSTPAHTSESPCSQAKALGRAHPSLGIAMGLYLIGLGAAYLLCLFGLAASVRLHGWTTTIVMATPLLYFLVVTLGTDAQARYRLPFLPALFLFASGGIRMNAEEKTT